MGIKEQIEDIRAKIIKGLEKSYEKLILSKIKDNSVLVFSENGKIIKVKPKK